MSRPWMPFYIADYLADTGHLRTVEHGAYMLLIMHYWQTGGLPDDDEELSAICRMTGEEWSRTKSKLARLFGDGWSHKRIDEELVKASALDTKRRAAGKAGAEARYGSARVSNRMATASQTDGIARGNSQPHPQEENSLRSQKNAETHPPEPTAATELGTVLDQEHAAAVIEHRKKLRKPLTPHAARLLAGKFARWPEPNAAADEMIARGWQGFEPEWMDRRREGQGGRDPPKRGSAALSEIASRPFAETFQ